MPDTYTYDGQCHCGAIQVRLDLSQPATDVGLRACQCGFCRPRGVTTVADPDGAATLTTAREANLIRYRFGYGIADYLLCATCGTYVGATQDDDGRRIATLNIAGLDVAAFAGRHGDPVRYDNETDEERSARRATAWMPLGLTFTATH